MNRLKKGRRPVRGQITKLINSVETALKKPVEELDKTDLRVSPLQLEDLCRDLHEWDEKVTEAMLDEEVTEAEQDKEYDERLRHDRIIKRMREELEKVLNPKKAFRFLSSAYTREDRDEERSFNARREIATTSGFMHSDISPTLREKFKCIFCDNGHPSQDCRKGMKMGMDQKNDKIKRCFKCLLPGHRSRQFKQKVCCDFCKRDGHYAIMCRGVHHAETERKSPQRPQNSTSTPGSSDVATVNEMSNCVSTKACLETLLVKVWGPKGSKVKHFMSGIGHYQIARCIRKPTFGSWARKLASKKIQLSAFKAESDVVELLLGADINPKIATANMIRLSDDRIARETLLGCVVQGKTEGKFPDKNPNQVHNSMLITSLLTQEIKISDLWSLENIGVMDDGQAESKKETDQAVMDKFRTETKRLVSEKRLLSPLQQDISRMGGKWDHRKIQSDQDNTLEYFLPHRAVVKSGSSTTPVRPVFDASCKPKGGWSLNDCLAKGPNLLELIPDIMLRFQLNKIGVVADIEKAFLQISVAKEDRQFLRFLWWEEQENLRIYQHKRVVFRVTSSPFLLVATLKLHLEQYENEREVIQLLKMYVHGQLRQ
ncbi:hypothetical protein LAZ67_15003308 [Cordylochernes scorpioides]|uniref:Peptidase aspartic putative domain-containing protein n=1 Tax=Cordylochernes scorpioides TaxID=51811 RepID=A0ABY6LBF1_9ARAC|nr:hypothetical protein LAZ67_15003308 [Cordylochernes scorpioides]